MLIFYKNKTKQEGRTVSEPKLKVLEVEESRHAVRRKLPRERKGFVHRFVVGGHKGYLRVGMYPDGTIGEIFIGMSKMGSTLQGVLHALSISVSLLLQYGVPLGTLVQKYIRTRYEPSGHTSNPDIPFATSITDYVFRWLGGKFLSPEGKKEILHISPIESQSLSE